MKKSNFSLGELYILENAAMPDMVKIGFTEFCSEQRAAELSLASGVPLPFNVAESFLVENPYEVEKIIHHHLEDYRLNKKREFFNLSIDAAFSEIGYVLFKTRNQKEIRLKQVTSNLKLAFKYPEKFGDRSKKEILTFFMKPILDSVGKKKLISILNNLKRDNSV